jgi:hypothetical protein
VTETGRPYRTVFEPIKSRKAPEKRLVDLLIEHYDELERLLVEKADGNRSRRSVRRGVSAADRTR